MTTSMPLWTVKQVAEHLAISERHIYKLTRENRLPYLRIGSALRFRPAEIDAWLEAKALKAVR